MRVVGIDAGESAARVAAIRKRLNVSYPIASDPGPAAAALRAFPTTLIIRDGRIVRYKVGDYSEITRYLDASFAAR